jgi:hypothetical protein
VHLRDVCVCVCVRARAALVCVSPDVVPGFGPSSILFVSNLFVDPDHRVDSVFAMPGIITREKN